MKFIDKLLTASRKNNSLLCVGLDPDPALLPPDTGVLEFNKAIIDATADLVCAYKLNFAFYEALDSDGFDCLKRSLDCIPPEIPAIGDAKRGDIGNTAKAYARAVFDVFGFDAVTANPYLGFDGLEPFLGYKERGVFILCRTSNAGAKDFQSLTIAGTGKALFEVVADKAEEWNTNRNIGLVVGATYPEELKLLRERHPSLPFLIPGVGAQGGDLAAVIRDGTDARGRGAIINSSRQIIFASRGKDFAEAARKAAQTLRDQINQQRAVLGK